MERDKREGEREREGEERETGDMRLQNSIALSRATRWYLKTHMGEEEEEGEVEGEEEGESGREEHQVLSRQKPVPGPEMHKVRGVFVTCLPDCTGLFRMGGTANARLLQKCWIETTSPDL